MRSVICLVVALVWFLALPTSAELRYRSAAPIADQVAAVQALISRFVPPNIASQFTLSVLPVSQNGTDNFHIASLGGKIALSGSSGVALASAFNYYLKHYCNAQVTWNQTHLNLSLPLPTVSPPVAMTTPYKYRYEFNTCTFGYSTTWWSWKEWQRQIDWMALNGINLPLAFVGQEKIWQEVYLDLGLSQSDIDDFFTGPAFLPWQRMGNVYDWAGPLPQTWLDGQAQLQQQILSAERAFGMQPVLAAFAGHVPWAFKTHYPNATVSLLSDWNSFNGTAFLDPHDPMFQTIGSSFVQKQTALYGTDHYYNCDPFNEVEPDTNSTTWIAEAGQAIYAAMATVDSQAVWVMQGWFLVNAADFWQPPQAEALLTSVPQESLLMLDLFSEDKPVYNITKSFYNRYWIWNMLNNFGGRMGLFGTFSSVSTGPSVALSSSPTLQGIGMTMEALSNNYVMYDMICDLMWTCSALNVSLWLPQYLVRRYGSLPVSVFTAWEFLKDSVYGCVPSENFCEGTIISLIQRRPSMSMLGISTELYYDPLNVMLNGSSLMNGSDLFVYDLVEVVRQVLANLHLQAYTDMIAAANSGDLASATGNSSLILSIINDMDTLAATRSEFLLGNWLSDATSWGTTPNETLLYVGNAKLQVTLWGYPTSSLPDYAGKLWSGLLADFYLPRWILFCKTLLASVSSHSQFPEATFLDEVIAIETAWANSPALYPTTPVGNALSTAQRLFAKYVDYVKGAKARLATLVR